jgi:hypothetical protein
MLRAMETPLRSPFRRYIKPFVDRELLSARAAREQDDAVTEFHHLERAHVLGQSSTSQHVKVHALMLAWGLRNRRPAEVAGQVLRIVGAALFTGIGLVPSGNTGGSAVSPFKPMPIPEDLRAILAQADGRGGQG